MAENRRENVLGILAIVGTGAAEYPAGAVNAPDPFQGIHAAARLRTEMVA